MAKHNGVSGYGWVNGEQEGCGPQRSGMTDSTDQANGSTIFNPYYTGTPKTPVKQTASIDRQEIIRRIKSRESRPTSPEETGRPPSGSYLGKRKSPSPSQQGPDAREKQSNTLEPAQDNQTAGLAIERPRSALHRGDFRDKDKSAAVFDSIGGKRVAEQDTTSLSTSPVAPWHPSLPSGALRNLQNSPSLPLERPSPPSPRSRAISSASRASPFVYKAPTSPLVQASRPDTPEPPTRQRSGSPDKSRRHTFSPRSFQRLQSALEYPASARHPDLQPPALRSEKTFPYQAHQPRRSLNSFASLPQTPAIGSRRPSLSDAPLHHASLVGSYEESILRGRMSTTPSKPLDFVAQIGVLGKGDCKPSLKCPPHAIIPFPAVFYSYGTGTTSTANQPSPYVGLVDLENHLPTAASGPDMRRRRVNAVLSAEGSRASSRTRDDSTVSDVQARRRRRQKQRRRSASPKAPPKGSYRIPERGQLQIVIKNPNKTAVKLFLVPYDLSDMEPGQKTFIRQRSYSAGPIIDMPLTSGTNLGTDRPEASLNPSDDPQDRPTLRYLIHLHICCPSKGRYYLYKSIRVVFANRVPDGKEKLRNEIQLPEPRYSVYKPGAESSTSASTTPKESRRRSAMDTHLPVDVEDDWRQTRQMLAQSLPSSGHNGQFKLPAQGYPFARLSKLPTLESRPVSRQTNEAMDVDQKSTPVYPAEPPASSPAPNNALDVVKKLNDPFNFERDCSRERLNGRSESLLSRMVQDLAFQAQRNGGNDG